MTKPKAPMSKSAFVRSLPKNLSAKQVVEREKKLKPKIELNAKYVYVIRSNDRRKAGSRKPSRLAKTGESRTEIEFRRLAIELGLERADQLLSETRKKVAAIIARG